MDLSSFNLPDDVKPFIFFDESPNPEIQARCIDEIEIIIRTKKKSKAKETAKFNSRTFLKPSNYMQKTYMNIAGYSSIIKELETEIYEYVTSNLQKIIDNLRAVIDAMKTDPRMRFKLVAYSDESAKQCSNNKNYRKLKKKLKTVTKKQEKVAGKGMVMNLNSQIRVEIMNSLNQFDEEIEYAPPSQLDEIITEFL